MVVQGGEAPHLYVEGRHLARGGAGQARAKGRGVWVVCGAGHHGGGEGAAHDVGGVEQLAGGDDLGEGERGGSERGEC